MSSVLKRMGEDPPVPFGHRGDDHHPGAGTLSVYTVFAIPYRQAIQLWRGGENLWIENPRNAAPAWFNLFRRQLARPRWSSSRKEVPERKAAHDLDGLKEVRIELPVYFHLRRLSERDQPFSLGALLRAASPYISVTWITPDGREIVLADQSIKREASIRLSQDTRLERRLRGLAGRRSACSPNPDRQGEPVPLKGEYQLVVDGLLFEAGDDLDAKLVVYGQLHGLAGTDHRRRDLTVALLWGAPIALAFGFLAASARRSAR